MSAEEDSDAEKEHEPTQKRLDDARKKGELPRSNDIGVAAGYAGLLIAALVAGAAVVQSTGQIGMSLLDQADTLAPAILTTGRAQLGGILIAFCVALVPIFILPMAAVLLAFMAQNALVFAPDRLAINWSRLSPISIAKQKFGRDGVFEFGKSFFKLIVFSGILGLHLFYRAPNIFATMQLSPAIGTGVMLNVMIEFLFLVMLVAGAIGGVDFMWQRAQHLRRNRMSRKDLMDEMKESDGDPQMKAQRRQRALEIATNQMLNDVATAEVIVVNPEHYAVALKWNRAGRAAPVCVAKGVDEIAARIRERAATAGVPLHRDPPTARAIHASVGLGESIRPEHFRAVAAAIRFAEAMKKRRMKLRS